MSIENVEIGEDDLIAVAVAAARDMLADIEVDGKALPVRYGQHWPEDVKDLPVIQLYATQETYDYGAGRVGSRVTRINAILDIVPVFALPTIKLGELDRKIGRVRAEIKSRIAADPHLRVCGKVWATDVELLSIRKGLAGAGQGTVVVNHMQISCIIHAREGERLPLTFQ